VIVVLAVGGILVARRVMTHRELVPSTDPIEIGHNTYLHLEENRTIVELKDKLMIVKKDRDHYKAEAEALAIKLSNLEAQFSSP